MKDLLEVKTLKMLLQPIVENAVFHGLEKKSTTASFGLRCKRLSRTKFNM